MENGMRSMGNRVIKAFLKAAALLGACIVAFSFALVLANAIPTSLMSNNAYESVTIMKAEGGDAAYMSGGGVAPELRVVNFTNAIMLGTAVHGDNLGIRGAFGNYSFDSPEVDAKVDELEQSLSQEADPDDPNWVPYARYWHGYLVILKPLLVFFNILQIRTILFASMSMLIIYVATKLAKICGMASAAAFSIPFLVGAYPVAALSLSFASCFLIALATCVYILNRYEETGLPDTGSMAQCLMISGALTSYFDFLCNPLLTLGLPLAVVVFLAVGSQKACISNLPSIVLRILVVSIAWALGYATIWASKWMISSLVLGQDIVGNALANLLYRSGTTTTEISGVAEFSIADVLSLNFGYYFPRWVLVALAAISVVYIIVYACVKKRSRLVFDGKRAAWAALIFLVIGCMPYLWYAVIVNHSYVHAWFTYRNQIITLMCILFALSSIFPIRLEDRLSNQAASRLTRS